VFVFGGDLGENQRGGKAKVSEFKLERGESCKAVPPEGRVDNG
jgi:hypothetical protein